MDEDVGSEDGGSYSNTTSRKNGTLTRVVPADAQRIGDGQILDKAQRLSFTQPLEGMAIVVGDREGEIRCQFCLVSGLGLILPGQPKCCLMARMKILLETASMGKSIKAAHALSLR